MKISSKHLHSQTVRARKLKFSKKVHLPPPVMCYLSHVTCHMSHVTCPISCLTFSSSFFSLFIQGSEASPWRVCYQLSLPRLFFFNRFFKGVPQWRIDSPLTVHQMRGSGGQFRFTHALPMYPTISETLGPKEVIYAHLNQNGTPGAPLAPLNLLMVPPYTT